MAGGHDRGTRTEPKKPAKIAALIAALRGEKPPRKKPTNEG